MRTEFKTTAVMMFLICAVLFLIYQNPNDTPRSRALEKYSNEIIELNKDSKKYQSIEDEQKFDQSKTSMQEKLKEVSLDSMGLEITDVELLDGHYPFWDAHNRIAEHDWVSPSICDFAQDIPLHMQKISQTDNFQKFAKKYSSYPIELLIMDERSSISNIHYGLTATNNENQHASTYFHLDSCTNEITDKESYFLGCSDEKNNYQFSTFNPDDVISSYLSGHFCKIELDTWRQSLYEYSRTLYEKQRHLETQLLSDVVDQESHLNFMSEMNKLGNLRNLVGRTIQGNLDEQSIQENIQQYENKYGSIPEELSELIRNRK